MKNANFEIDREQIQDLFVDWLYDNGFDGYGYYDNQEHENITDRGGFENEIFLINPFYWGEDEDIQDKPNFVFKPMNIEIEWYKYPMRSAYSNKRVTYGDMKRILATCKSSISKKNNLKSKVKRGNKIKKKAINSYKDISKYIDKENYLFTVENVIKEYKAFKRGCWTSAPIREVIYKYKNQIKTIIKYRNKKNGLPADY